MNVRELMDELEDADPDAEIVFVMQPHWPFYYSIEGAHTTAMFNNSAPMNPHSEEREEIEENRVFLVEGRQIGYASKRHFEM